ncbi:hypothetical protein BV898_12676 [Hypsibius exemplaris]|uniref:BTB domain-containing protein n=1 Tax=Hypsibius exemplaris TaxID=2072580 RepID=A0A1W0WD97_HYPEX|nr:hypothetical protein BV898_12676 [Hypsibius exemplaris]
MDIRVAWKSLQSTIIRLLKFDPTDAEALYSSSEMLAWSRNPSVQCGCEDPTRHHIFECYSGPSWILDLYSLPVALGGMLPTWSGGIFISKKETQSHPALKLDLSFGPVLFGGFASHPPTPQWTTSSGMAAPNTHQQLKFDYLWEHMADCALKTTANAAMAAAVAQGAHVYCSVIAKTKSRATYLAIQINQLPSQLFEPSARELTIITRHSLEMTQPRTDKFLVYTGDRQFWVDQKDALMNASPVFAACLSQPEFLESKERKYDMSTFSSDAVEQFLLFCLHRTAPRFEDLAADLVAIGHLYAVHELVLICEVYLVRRVVLRCDDAAELRVLCKVAHQFSLPLLLATLEMVVNERLPEWNTDQMEAWAAICEDSPGFEVTRIRNRKDLPGISLADDLAIIRPNWSK